MPEIADPKLREVAQELNCSNSTLYSLLNSGELEGYYIGTQLRVRRHSLDLYKVRNAYEPGKRRNTNAPGRAGKPGGRHA